ncbi:hypothetical protein CRENBAI_011744, partial [Crenichthys baileyi]
PALSGTFKVEKLRVPPSEVPPPEQKSRPRKSRPHLPRFSHLILQGREQFGEYHHLLQELHLDDGQFRRYFRLSRTQFEDLLSCVGRRIGLWDTNYRRYIPAAERLSICLRHIQSLIDAMDELIFQLVHRSRFARRAFRNTSFVSFTPPCAALLLNAPLHRDNM